MTSREWRYVAAVFAGVAFHVVFIWKFLPYTPRESAPGLLPGYWLPIFAFVLGLLLTLSLKGKKRWIPTVMLGACFLANACLIVSDCAEDPTNHNLWPFEFVIIAVAMAPAYLGAGISSLVDRVRSKSSQMG
jgi:cell division protein FtsW (lipid II flippase)